MAVDEEGNLHLLCCGVRSCYFRLLLPDGVRYSLAVPMQSKEIVCAVRGWPLSVNYGMLFFAFCVCVLFSRRSKLGRSCEDVGWQTAQPSLAAECWRESA